MRILDIQVPNVIRALPSSLAILSELIYNPRNVRITPSWQTFLPPRCNGVIKVSYRKTNKYHFLHTKTVQNEIYPMPWTTVPPEI